MSDLQAGRSTYAGGGQPVTHRRRARAAFSCGVAPLDRYLQQHAGQDVAKRVAVAFVLAEPSAPAVVGFYTLAVTSLRLQELPPAMVKRFPKYPQVPATLLGRLAGDLRARGRGYGELLLLDALARSLKATTPLCQQP